MTTTITLDPATRVEGHLKIKIEVADGKVQTAFSSGTMFRGFESLVVGKDPRDASHITQRVCGVCPISHGIASCLAVEAASDHQLPPNARLVRNLIQGANFIESHIFHFYHLSLLSYIEGPPKAPWTPSYRTDLRLSPIDNQRMVDSYLKALTARRETSEMAAVLAGKFPHAATLECGGVSGAVSADAITKFGHYLDEVQAFIDDVYLEDVDLLAKTYGDYLQIGRGYGNLLAFGALDGLFRGGRVVDGESAVQAVEPTAIIEHKTSSWYDGTAGNPAEGSMQPNADKATAYSWIQAPRYDNAPYECGPLARMWVNGEYRSGVSVMDRHRARALEASKIAKETRTWLSQIDPAAPFYTACVVPSSGSGTGLTEAPRGALGHWIRLEAGLVAAYQIVTPTCWNCSPRDDRGLAGPLEKALEGTPVANPAEPVEVLRVVQSYDPCLACAVH